MIKRIASYVTVFCMVVSLFSVSAFAADVEAMESEQTVIATTDLVFEEGSVVSTEILPVSDGEYSVAPLAEDYGVATTAVTYTLADIYDMLWAYDETSTARSVGGSLVALVGHAYNTYVRLGTTNNWLNSINQNITAGTSVLNSLLTQLQTVNGNLSASLYAAVGDYFLSYDGSLIQLTAKEDLTYIVRSGFMGLRNALSRYFYYDGSFLAYDGTITTSGANLSRVIRDGFIALGNGLKTFRSSFHDLISGSETDNTYSGTVTTNENTETNISSVGLGPMLNTWLDSIQHDTGLLTYMFASPEDLEAKAKSADLTQSAMDEFYSDSDDASISAGKVTALKGVTSDLGDYMKSDYSISDFFGVLNNEEQYAWFSEETANQLDNVVTAVTFGLDNETDYEKYNMDIYYAHISQVYPGKGE